MKEHAKEHCHEEQLESILDGWVAEAEEAGVCVKGREDGSIQERLSDLIDAFRDKCVRTSKQLEQKKMELQKAKADQEFMTKCHEKVRQENQSLFVKEVSRLEGELEQLRGEVTGVKKERDDLVESNKETVAAVEKLQQEIQDLEHVREDCTRLEKQKNELVDLKEAVEMEKERAKEELLQNEKLRDVQVEQQVEIEKLKTEVAQLNQACIQKDKKIQELEKVSHTIIF